MGEMEPNHFASDGFRRFNTGDRHRSGVAGLGVIYDDPPGVTQADNEAALLGFELGNVRGAGSEGEENGDDEDSDEEEEPEERIPVAILAWPPWRNRVRKIVLKNGWFERFWLLVIVGNCMTLAIENPTDHKCETDICHITSQSDIAFTILFTIECVVKIIGLGFAKPLPGAYIRDLWNILDFFIVITGILALFASAFLGSSGSGVTALRAFRLLRPLKAVQAFPSVRILVASIFSSLPHLLDVCILYTFFLIVMGILAIQQFKGLFRWGCRPDPSVLPGVDDEIGERTCASHDAVTSFGGYHCDWGYKCVGEAPNPQGGKLHFDDIGVAMLTLFTALTLEGWTETMYRTMDGTTYFAVIFWIVLIVFGAFFVLNLTIVVITEAFEQQQYLQKTEAFRAIDTDDGGTLDKDEVRRLYKRTFQTKLTQEELDSIFGEMDADGSGGVTFEEFEHYTKTHHAMVGSVITGKSVNPSVGVRKGLSQRFGSVFNLQRSGPRSGFRKTVYMVVVDPAGFPNPHELPTANSVFNQFITYCVFLNTVVLGIHHYGEPYDLSVVLFWCNNVFTIIFCAEAVLKLFGMGLLEYFGDAWCRFDFFIVGISLMEMIMNPNVQGDSAAGGVSALRAFRVLRVLKLARKVKQLQRWIVILISSMKAAAILTALITLFIFIAALLGMQAFGGEFCEAETNISESIIDAANWTVNSTPPRGSVLNCLGTPRANYDSLVVAFLTTFQIMTGEDWNAVMYMGMQRVGNWVSIYFVASYVLGNYMLLNLFIAVLLANRPEDDEKEKVEQQDIDNIDNISSVPIMEVTPKRTWLPGFLEKYVERGNSFFIFEEENVVRKAMDRLCSHWTFETVVMLAIAVSTVTLAIENPMKPVDHRQNVALEQVNFWMVCLFTAEALFKSISYGFILHPTSYLRREHWNQLDFFIVVTSIMSVLIPGGDKLEFVRLARTLRPLRFINKSEGMKVVVQALLGSIKPLSNVMLISLIVWLIFAILGVDQFAGKFSRCSLDHWGDVESGVTRGEYVTAGVWRGILDPSFQIVYKGDCENSTICSAVDEFGEVKHCRWLAYASNFDNILSASITLFEVSSLEGWVSVMWLAIDGREKSEAALPWPPTTLWEAQQQSPHLFFDRNGSTKIMAVLFFLSFVVFGAFFIINMFIGVLIDTYYTEKEKAKEEGKSRLFETYSAGLKKGFILSYSSLPSGVCGNMWQGRQV